MQVFNNVYHLPFAKIFQVHCFNHYFKTEGIACSKYHSAFAEVTPLTTSNWTLHGSKFVAH